MIFPRSFRLPARAIQAAVLCLLLIAVAPSEASINPTRTLEQSLALAGPNRPELQKFLDAHKGADAELLIRTARPGDLINLTNQLLSDNLQLTEKAKSTVPWAGHVPPEIWQEFVLPYRVADEPLDDFKPELYEKIFSTVAAAPDSGAAALLVHNWYFTGNNGLPWVTFRVTESRDQSPRTMLDHTQAGRCFEMNLLCVALLRSVGIPARIAGIPWWMNCDFYHYWVEYYDTKTASWLYFEGSTADTDQMLPKTLLHKSRLNLVYPVVYALPGFCPIADPIGKERWDVLINTTELYLPTGTLHFSASRDPRYPPPTFTIYTWNLSSWRSVAQATGNDQGTADIKVSANNDNYPYLVSIGTGRRLFWDVATVTPKNETDVSDLTISQQPKDQIASLVPSAKNTNHANPGEQ